MIEKDIEEKSIEIKDNKITIREKLEIELPKYTNKRNRSPFKINPKKKNRGAFWQLYVYENSFKLEVISEHTEKTENEISIISFQNERKYPNSYNILEKDERFLIQGINKKTVNSKTQCRLENDNLEFKTLLKT